MKLHDLLLLFFDIPFSLLSEMVLNREILRIVMNNTIFLERMTDTVILPTGTIIHKVFAFEFEHEEKQVSVVFLNYGNYERTDADHSFEAELRNNFARMLLQQPPAPARNMWLPLPDHEYLNRLRGNNFNYVAYNIVNFDAANRVHISVKAETVDPPLVYSRIFPPRRF